MSRLATTKEQFKEVVSLNNNFPFGMLCGAIVLIVAGAVASNDNNGASETFALVGGIVLTLLSLAYIYLIYHGMLSESAESLFSIVLFVTWTVVSAYVTFEGPFDNIENGFIASWLGFIASVGNLIYNVRWADSMKEKFVGQGLPLGLLLINSVIVLIAGIAKGCCDNQDIVAVIAGSVSTLFVVLRIFLGPRHDRIFGLFLIFWWTPLGVILTFGEFGDEGNGNGFFATWICIISSYFLLSTATFSNANGFSAKFSSRMQKPQQMQQPVQAQPVNQNQGYGYEQPQNDKEIEELF